LRWTPALSHRKQESARNKKIKAESAERTIRCSEWSTSQYRVTFGASSPGEFIRPAHRESRQAGKAGSSRISCITGKLSHFNKDLFKIFIFLDAVDEKGWKGLGDRHAKE